MPNEQIAIIPQVANIQAAPRQQHLWDTEGYQAGAAMTNITLFNNPAAFATAGLVAKQFGRDASISGNLTLLPQGQYFLWGAISLELHSMAAIESTLANSVLSEERDRIRRITFTHFDYDRAPYIYWRSRHLPDACGPTGILTTHGASTVMGQNMVPDGKGLPVTVLSNARKIPQLTSFTVVIETPALAFNPTVATYATVRLHGTLLRGIRP